jgi:hypothetical protein
MSATYGRILCGSSASADLTQSLASRLKQQLDLAGSMEYRQIWKRKTTPSGRSYWAHIASAVRTSDKDCTGWPTTKAKDGREWSPNAPPDSSSGHGLGAAAQPTPWPTARQSDGEKNVRSVEGSARELERKGGPQDLNQAATLLSPWATASSRDWKDTPGMATTGTNPDGTERKRLDQLPRQAQLCPWRSPTSGDSIRGTEENPKARNPKAGTGSLNNEANLAGWVSPTAQDGTRGGLPPRPQDTGVPLSQQVSALEAWPTPQANKITKNSKDPKRMKENGVQTALADAAWLTSGPTSASSKPETGSTGASRQLNPAFSMWLMSLPTAWLLCGVLAHLKARSKKSSKRARDSRSPAKSPGGSVS